MRKVKYCESGFFDSKHEATQPKNIQEGTFHGLFQCGNNDEGIDVYAMIETFLGTMKAKDTGQIKFINTVAEKKLFPENTKLITWLEKASKMVSFQGLPSRICWLKYGEREKAGLLFNKLVRDKKVKAPIVIGRDHLDCGSVASPNRETESMKDGTDAVSDWPLLNLMINTMNGASWTSFHHGGGVGIGFSQHAGMVIVADGTKEAEVRLDRVLTYDPGMGIVRHADAGYERAIKNAKEQGVKIPMMK